MTITGTGFTGATAVDFGTTAATRHGGQRHPITATSPAAPSARGRDRDHPGGHVATSPPISSPTPRPSRRRSRPDPTTGSDAGGTSVTITGTSFTGATVVDFGTDGGDGRHGGQRHHDHGHQPGGHHGTVDVTVTTPAGTSATSTADQFTYTRPRRRTGRPRTPSPDARTSRRRDQHLIREAPYHGGFAGRVDLGGRPPDYPATCSDVVIERLRLRAKKDEIDGQRTRLSERDWT